MANDPTWFKRKVGELADSLRNVAPERRDDALEALEDDRPPSERQAAGGSPDASPDPADWLEALCRQILWTERELLNVLADLPPGPSADDAARHSGPALREEVRRIADDAIEVGELHVRWGLLRSDLEQVREAVQDPALLERLERTVYASAHYDQRYTVEPEVAIRWALSRRELFRRCRLTAEHLALVRGEGPAGGILELATGAGDADDPAEAKRQHRYRLITQAQDQRGLNGRAELGRRLGMSKSAIEGIVRDEGHRASTDKRAKLMGFLRDALKLSEADLEREWNRIP